MVYAYRIKPFINHNKKNRFDVYMLSIKSFHSFKKLDVCEIKNIITNINSNKTENVNNIYAFNDGKFYCGVKGPFFSTLFAGVPP